MSREPPRKGYFSRDPRNRDRGGGRNWDRRDYRSRPLPMNRKSRSPDRGRMSDLDKRRSRSPRKPDKEPNAIDDNILSEISKLPEPSELWDNQFQDGSGNVYPGPPLGGHPPFRPEPPLGNAPYGGGNYQPQPPYSGIYDDFPPVNTMPAIQLAPEMEAWNQMSLPPPPTTAVPPAFPTPEDQLKKEAAIESEMRHQKAALSKQREDYMKKAAILKKELNTLKDQRTELKGDTKRSPSPDTKRFLKENTKLQLEIQNKLKTINNVVDMLDGIIGEEAQTLPDDIGSPEPSPTKRKSRSPSTNQKFNYVYYDPEMHWCRVCNEFPPTAKDYLNHLHSAPHHKMAAAHMEAPWHTVSGINEGFQSYPSAPTKRTPIKGLQFFVPSTAWYCKLCDQFIGDLHCASAHLKSIVHSKNYTNFVEQNPHWETDWMSDRQKAFEKARASTKNKQTPVEEKPQPQYTAHTITFNKDGFHTKKKSSPPPDDEKKKKKDKKKNKKKKRNSSSSDSSDSSSSDSDSPKKKKKKKEKMSPDDKTLTKWMTAIQNDRLNESDRKLLDTLKSRMKMERPETKRPSVDRASSVKRNRESVRRESRDREREREREKERERERERERNRERDRESRRRELRAASRSPRRSNSPPPEPKKPEIRKMPFIGKMPVYKNLGRTTKTEDQKKDDEKKKEEEEASKKRREEMDAEIQKKVAEFKEKIALAQLERAQLELGPPAVALPTSLGAATTQYAPPPPPPPQPTLPPPVPPQPQPPPPAAPQTPASTTTPALPKDFQEALDIIFPTGDVKPEIPQPADIFSGMASSLASSFTMGLGGVVPTFPPFLQPQMPQMPTQMMMGFDMNSQMFPRRPQLYDGIMNSKPRKRGPNKNTYNKKTVYNTNKKQMDRQNNKDGKGAAKNASKDNGEAKKREELDDLAMLGMDASDVGAGM